MLLSAVVSGALGTWVFGRAALLLSAVAGLLLGAAAASLLLRIAVRLIAIEAVLVFVAVVLGVVSSGRPVVAALSMAGFAFVCSMWTAVPVVGALASTYPVLILVLVMSREDAYVGDGSLLRAAGFVMAGVVGAVLVAVLRSAPHPGRARRRLAAVAWSPSTPVAAHAGLSRLLFLDGAPRVLQAVAAYGGLVAIVRDHLHRHLADPDRDAGLATLDAGSTRISTALAAPGPVAELAPGAAAGGAPGGARRDASGESRDHAATTTAAALAMATDAQRRAADLLAGRADVTGWPARPTRHLVRSMVRAFTRPSSSVFRFAVQRSLVLAAGALAIVLTDTNQSAYWITITLLVTMQESGYATTTKVVQRAAGTFAGVLLVLLLGWLLPPDVLSPWGTLLLLAIALAWSRRNYAVQNVFMAAAMVIVYGLPAGDIPLYAGYRALDVAVGGLIAVLVMRVVLPVRPRLAQRAAAYADAVRATVPVLREHLRSGDPLPTHALARGISGVDAVRSNYASDVALLASSQQRAERDRLQRIDSTAQTVLVVALLAAGLAHVPAGASTIVDEVLDDAEADLALGGRPSEGAASP